MSTPIPRTSSAIIASGFQAVPEGFRAFAGILERELTALTTERDELRAELAAERARLDWLQAQEVKRGLEITEGHDDPLPFLVLDEDGTTHWGDTYRAAIDAAMKEGAK